MGCRLLPISGCIIFVWLLAGTLFYKYVLTSLSPFISFQSTNFSHQLSRMSRLDAPVHHLRASCRYNAKFRSSQAFYFTVQSGFSVGFGVKGVMANDAADPELARWCVRVGASLARIVFFKSTSSSTSLKRTRNSYMYLRLRVHYVWLATHTMTCVLVCIEWYACEHDLCNRCNSNDSCNLFAFACSGTPCFIS